MPTPDWDTLAPTEGTPANSFEFGVDVFIGATWVNIPDITAVNPAFTPKVRARTSYAAKGQALGNKYADDMVLSFNVEIVRDALGQYQEELQFLVDAGHAKNAANRVRMRTFDTLGADEAYEGIARIGVARQGTGDDEAAWKAITATGYGEWEKIANPVNDALLPGLMRVGPTGQAATEAVAIHGLAFTGATGVKFGAVNATSFEVIDDRNLIAVLPAGSAGNVAVTVITPAGTSAGLAYTRGA